MEVVDSKGLFSVLKSARVSFLVGARVLRLYSGLVAGSYTSYLTLGLVPAGDSSWMAVSLLGWYQVVINMRLAVMRIKVKTVDILMYLSECMLITSYTTPDTVANKYQAMPIVEPASACITE